MFNKRKIIFLILFLIAFGLFLIFLQKFPIQEEKVIPTITPIIKLSVISTKPVNGAKNIISNTPIVINFNRELSVEEKQLIYLKTKPEIEFDITSEDTDTLIAKPKTKYQINSIYLVSINFKDQLIHSIKFDTNEYTTEQLDEQIKVQKEGDLLFGKEYSEFIKEYPWNQKLPIIKDEYIVDYSFTNNAFRIRLTSKSKNESEKMNLTQKALADLKGLGIDTEKYNHYVLEP